MKNCPQCRSGPTTRTLAKLRKTGARLNGAKAEAVGAQRAIGGQRTCRKRRRRVDPSSGNSDGIAPSMLAAAFGAERKPTDVRLRRPRTRTGHCLLF